VGEDGSLAFVESEDFSIVGLSEERMVSSALAKAMRSLHLARNQEWVE
jgi:hypothetical protein